MHPLTTMIKPIISSKTALLLLDYQNFVIQRLSLQQPFIENCSNAIDIVRKRGVHIAHVRTAFEEVERDELPVTNFSFARMKESPEFFNALRNEAQASAFDSQLGPKDNESVYRKTRVGPFITGPSSVLHEDLKQRGIDTLIVAGLATSGAVLSAIRQAADLDYQLYVVEDLCADAHAEVHKILMHLVFPKQAFVIQSDQLEGLLK